MGMNYPEAARRCAASGAAPHTVLYLELKAEHCSSPTCPVKDWCDKCMAKLREKYGNVLPPYTHPPPNIAAVIARMMGRS